MASRARRYVVDRGMGFFGETERMDMTRSRHGATRLSTDIKFLASHPHHSHPALCTQVVRMPRLYEINLGSRRLYAPSDTVETPRRMWRACCKSLDLQLLRAIVIFWDNFAATCVFNINAIIYKRKNLQARTHKLVETSRLSVTLFEDVSI